jgi:hypothetical protein
MNRSLRWILCIIGFASSSCGDTSELRVLYVGPDRIDCVGVGPQLCYQINDVPEAPYTHYYDEIEGFDHRKGFEYVLQIEVLTVENPAADASSIRYRLVQELSRKALHYVRITSPVEGGGFDASGPLIVAGTGRGLFEGNVVVRVEDAEGRQLALVPTILDAPDIAAAGAWRASIPLARPVPSEIRVVAFSPSPVEGEAAIESAPVTLSKTD